MEQSLLVLERLEQNGYESYFVGGCVRDWLLGRPVHDIDICTNAHPREVMRLFPDHVATGLRHGTVSVRQGGCFFEVTTFRAESGYTDFRRPGQVAFVSDLRLDLARRDFTINAMAMDRNGRLIDPFGGQQDLNDRLIRCVGTAEERFREDALRMLRAVRFAAQLGFELEPMTEKALQQAVPLLRFIAVERIRDELGKLIDSEYPEKGFAIISKTRLLQHHPPLDRISEQAKEEAWRLPLLGSRLQKWAYWLFAAKADPEQAAAALRMLKMAKRETEEMVRLVRLLHTLSPQWDQPENVDWRPFLLSYGLQTCEEANAILAVIWGKRRDGESRRHLLACYEQLPVKTIRQLAINGRDLQECFQRKPGDWIGRTLAHLLHQTALHGLPNTREALLAEAEKEVKRT